jgi:acyl-CoA reductase-like NAD-dependent aldehyde dehydrogenase
MTIQSEPTTARPETFDVVNPATRETVGTFPVHTAEDVARVVAEARDAQHWWAELGFGGRKAYLRRWLRWLALHCDEIYELGHGETARPKPDVQFELFAGLEDIRWAAAHAGRVLGPKRVAPGLAMLNFTAGLSYEPLGVIGVITPWNVPIYTTLSGMAYALAAGNAVVPEGQPRRARRADRLGDRLRRDRRRALHLRRRQDRVHRLGPHRTPGDGRLRPEPHPGPARTRW